MKGSLDSAGQMLGQMIKEQITGGIYENQQLLFKIACFAVIGAIFTNFAMAFSKEQVAETGFYLTYTLLMTLMMTSFIMTGCHYHECVEVIDRIYESPAADILCGVNFYNGKPAFRSLL